MTTQSPQILSQGRIIDFTKNGREVGMKSRVHSFNKCYFKLSTTLLKGPKIYIRLISFLKKIVFPRVVQRQVWCGAGLLCSIPFITQFLLGSPTNDFWKSVTV